MEPSCPRPACGQWLVAGNPVLRGNCVPKPRGGEAGVFQELKAGRGLGGRDVTEEGEPEDVGGEEATCGRGSSDSMSVRRRAGSSVR